MAEGMEANVAKQQAESGYFGARFFDFVLGVK